MEKKNINPESIEAFGKEKEQQQEQTVVNKTKKEPTALEKMQTKKETKEQTALAKQKAVTEIKKLNMTLIAMVLYYRQIMTKV